MNSTGLARQKKVQVDFSLQSSISSLPLPEFQHCPKSKCIRRPTHTKGAVSFPFVFFFTGDWVISVSDLTFKSQFHCYLSHSFTYNNLINLSEC